MPATEFVLSKEIIFSITHKKSLAEVEQINLFAKRLDNVDIASELVNIRIFSAPVNNISTLRPFANLDRLEELLLRRNNITDINEVNYLRGLRRLTSLSLNDNPICNNLPYYRQYIIRALPTLKKLDTQDITDSERVAAVNMTFPQGVNFELPNVVKKFCNNENNNQDVFATLTNNNNKNKDDDDDEFDLSENDTKVAHNNRPTWNTPVEALSDRCNSIQPPVKAPTNPRTPSQDIPSYSLYPNDPRSNALIQRDSHQQIPQQVKTRPNKNILMAIFALLKELDKDGLKVVSKEVDNLLQQ